MVLTDKEVYELTGLEGFRQVNHRLRKQTLLALAQQHFKHGAPVVDIGCAAGDLTIELQALGFQMTGVEFEPLRLERARAATARLGLPVRFISEDLTKWRNDGVFEGMIMAEILEHFSEPRKTLEAFLPRLAAGGKILVTVPNMASLRARLKLLFFGEFADHNPEHLFYFTRRRFIEHFRGLPVDVLGISSSLMEITFSRSVALAQIERAALAPLRLAMPYAGSHLVAVLMKTKG